MVKLLFFRFRVTNSMLKNKKIHFELLTLLISKGPEPLEINTSP